MKYPLIKDNLANQSLDDLITFLKTKPRLTASEKVSEFEQEWSRWQGCQYSIMVNSGSSANFATLLALKQRTNKKKIILSPLTWVSDINSIIWAGFEPVFIDISHDTLSIDHRLLKNHTEDIACIFITHILGLNALNKEIINFCHTHDIALIEDCCESHGATNNGIKVGNFGLAANFSFYYAHHITTIEGGMISTNDESFYDLCRMIRAHGMLRESSNPEFQKNIQEQNPEIHPEFIFQCQGFNFRPTEINAFLGLQELKNLDQYIDKRNSNFKYFLEGINDCFYKNYKLQGSSNYAFLLMLKDKDENLFTRICESLEKSGVEYRRGFSGGGNQLRQPYLRNIIQQKYTDFPKTEHVHKFAMYIGNYPNLEKKDIDIIIKAINV